jgi:hypothetical protein
MARNPKPNFEAETLAVDKARAGEELDRQNELLSLRSILTQPEVRDFLWRVMEHTQMFLDPMQQNFGIVGHSLGRAAVGKWVMNEIVEADPNAWLLMQHTHYQRQIEKAALAAADTEAQANSSE